MPVRIFIILFFIALIPVKLHSQVAGCTDYRALNYNPLATINDGSCVYEKTNFKAEEVISSLPVVLSENSGMFLFNGLFWFINDSGSPAEIYAYDSQSNTVKSKVRLKNARNIDWEAITDDSTFIYIGDFGNNNGDRKNLTIYRIKKEDITSPDTLLILNEYDSITFEYTDQLQFTPSAQNHDFDCEAMLVVDDSIYLFSKNWKNQKTRLYSLPAIPGHYQLTPVDSYQVDGLITDAAIDRTAGTIVLLGYKNYQPFFWLLWDYYQKNFFSGNKRRFDMPAHYLFQTEAACFFNSRTVYISSEKTPLTANRLFRADIDAFVSEKVTDLQGNENEAVSLFPNPGKNQFFLQFKEKINAMAELRIYDSMGRQIQVLRHQKISREGLVSIKTPELKAGNYYMLVLIHPQMVYRICFIVKDD
ncbi:MAG TPA: T9SS type A sorting domain-containing protein [Bacteroidia bacterium]|nr:T9SS type A sorting domain-containing protein [Bacteroidia bacterium]HRS58563.1 T9SS type A sorting domain-containing protein [Bacteroidia bacterium]HRU68405.1 T9SS type A sorting domain-containing protein [Bacteroidia bacterium]